MTPCLFLFKIGESKPISETMPEGDCSLQQACQGQVALPGSQKRTQACFPAHGWRESFKLKKVVTCISFTELTSTGLLCAGTLLGTK